MPAFGRLGVLSTRIDVLRQVADERRYFLPDNVIELLASRPAEDFAQLTETLDEVVTLARRAMVRPDMTFVEDCLRRGLPGDGTLRDAHVAADVTTNFYGLTLAELSCKPATRRKRQVRLVAMYLCFEFSKLSVQRIGQIFDSDASHVNFARHNVTGQMEDRPELRDEVAELRQRILKCLRQPERKSGDGWT
ncbi:helix-turn-helix domain-containing protein [Mycobacterium sp. MUNTM1]